MCAAARRLLRRHEPEHETAVISSPILGVFAVTAAGPGLRRVHVTCSGVFAVTAVTATSRSWSAPRVLDEVRCMRPELADRLRRRLVLPGRGSERAGRLSVRDDGRRCDRPDPRWAQALRWSTPQRRRRPRAYAPGRTEVLGRRLNIVRAGSSGCDPVPLSCGELARPARPSAGVPREHRSAETRCRSRPLQRLRRRHVYAGEMPAYQALSADDFR